jgi:uncharacterized protein YndB with AHSA1/START domain
MADRVSRISNEAVAKGTGKTWSEWIIALDLAGAAQWDHKTLVEFLAGTYHISQWWCQTIAIHYERMHRQRVVGQTSSAGFEIGIQRTISLAQSQLWDFITSDRGIAFWLGEVAALMLAVGIAYTTASGISGVFRVVNPPHHLRLTWQPAGWNKASTLQIRLIPVKDGKTSLRFHQEHLANDAIRTQMRQHWQEVLDKVSDEALKDCTS